MKKNERLLVSTKVSSGRKLLLGVCTFILFIFALFVLFNFKLIGQMGRELFNNSTATQLLFAVALVFMFALPVVSLLGCRSYCNVYETCVAGITALSVNHPNKPMQEFEIRYDEIRRVVLSGRTITLYTQYDEYEALAMSNAKEALNEIKKRIVVRN